MKLSNELKIGLAVIIPILVIVAIILIIGQLKSAICGSWSFDQQLCKDYIDGYSKIIGILIALATFTIAGTSAYFAINTYRKNSSLEHAKWLFNLYEKFYEKEHLKEIRNKLDCDIPSKEVENLVKKESFEFTDYLNFFEFVAFLKKSKQLTFEEIEDLFGYYLGCIDRHKSVRDYLTPNGYELLNEMLKELAEKKK